MRSTGGWENEGDWPPSYLVIGQDGCGGYYAIDVDEEYGPVYYWEHETCEFETAHGSLEGFADHLDEPGQFPTW